MPVPKKRHSNTRTNRRRANWKVEKINYGLCPSCGSPILTHRACPNCGSYQGRVAITIKEKKSKNKGE